MHKIDTPEMRAAHFYQRPTILMKELGITFTKGTWIVSATVTHNPDIVAGMFNIKKPRGSNGRGSLDEYQRQMSRYFSAALDKNELLRVGYHEPYNHFTANNTGIPTQLLLIGEGETPREQIQFLRRNLRGIIRGDLEKFNEKMNAENHELDELADYLTILRDKKSLRELSENIDRHEPYSATTTKLAKIVNRQVKTGNFDSITKKRLSARAAILGLKSKIITRHDSLKGVRKITNDDRFTDLATLNTRLYWTGYNPEEALEHVTSMQLKEFSDKPWTEIRDLNELL